MRLVPSASKDAVPISQEGGGYVGRYLDWGDLRVAFEHIPAGTDPTRLLKGLPDDRCQCPHWGFLFKGKIVVRYADHEEVIEAGQAYYIPPGHIPFFEEECEQLELSPRAEQDKTLEVFRRNLETAQRDE
jgi:hypothetical protein